MRFILVVAVLAIVLESTAGINGKNSGRKSMGCRGDFNATAGCDKTCKKRCPGPKPEVCRCPKINCCMCRTPYVYDPTVNKCVKRKDCAPPTTMEYTTTEVITTKLEESTKEDTTTVEEENTTTECIDSKDITVNDDDCEDHTPEPITTTVGTTADCDDYDGTTIPQNITTETNDSNKNPCSCNGSDSDPTNTMECEDEATVDPTYCDGETTTECDNETTEEPINCDDETTTACADETTTECDNETTEEPINCDDETTTECADETTTECADETTTECADETTTECADETTTECADETTTECADETTTECEDETTEEPTTTEVPTTTEEPTTTEAPTTTEVTTTEAIPTLDKCPEALERFKIKLYALNLKFLSSYALTFPKLSFSGVVLAPTLLLVFLMKFLKEPYFMMLSQATGLNTISEIVCVCNSINNITYNFSPGLAAGVAIGVKSNYTFTSNAERFMKEVIIGKLLTFSSNSSLDTLNEAISKLTNNNISNVINNIDDSDQMVFLSGVSLDTMINSNKSVVKPFYEAPFKYAPANYTVVRGMYYYAECPNIQAKIVNISSKDGDYSLIIVLPYAPFTVQKLIEKTSAENLWACIQSMKPCLVNAEVPQINTNTTINTLKLLKYANISSSLTSTAEYKDMFVGQTRINLTNGRQRATLQIRSAEPSHDHVHHVNNLFERQYFFVANTPYYQFVSWPFLGQMPVYGSVVASFAPGRQTSPSDD